MPSALDLYKFYLEAADLKGQSHAVKVIDVEVVPVFDPILKRNVDKLVMKFEKTKRMMTLNKTQVAAMIEITGTDDYSLWFGTTITVTPVMASNHKGTIAITAHPVEKGTQNVS